MARVSANFTHALNPALIFAPMGELVPAALRAVSKGDRFMFGGIYMSDIPSMPYAVMWGERQRISMARAAGTPTKADPLAAANEAFPGLRDGRLNGTQVLVP